MKKDRQTDRHTEMKIKVVKKVRIKEKWITRKTKKSGIEKNDEAARKKS